MRKQKLINSLDGSQDYNLVINGKLRKNFHINYPDTLYNFKKYRIDLMKNQCLPMKRDLSSDSDSDMDSDTTDTSTNLDNEPVILPIKPKHRAKMINNKKREPPDFDGKSIYNKQKDVLAKQKMMKDHKLKLK